MIKFILHNIAEFIKKGALKMTAKELAQKLNLSQAAVSMALNNKPGVSTATRKLVLETARQYGYDFTRISKNPQTAKSLYFVIYKKHGAIVMDTPFFSQLSEGIVQSCQEKDYKIKIVYVYEDEASLEKQIESIQYSDCIGIILLGTEMAPEDLKPFIHLPAPVVLLDSYFETSPLDCISINNIQGAFLATSYLIRKTKKQPGYLKSSYPIHNFNERSDGFYKAVRANGMSASKSFVHSLTPSIEGACADMLELLNEGEEPGPCYFADNDLIAAGALKAFRQKGFRIPQDIAIIGFDNLPICSIVEPSLTTMDVPKKYMGRLAAQRLISRIKEPLMPPVKIEVNVSLVERNSCF
jgi:LacI family transcriptional regulator